MKQQPEVLKYAAFGMTSLVPGMQYMVERMQRELDEMREMIARFQDNGAGKNPRRVAVGKRRGSNAWAGMSAEERSEEMKRRFAVRRKKQRSEAAATRWARMTRKQREEWKRKMQAGKKKKTAKSAKVRIPTVKVEHVNGRAAA